MAENVSAKQNAVIAALLCSGSILAAAEKVGCSPRTIHRFLKNESFKIAYREAKSKLLDGALNQMRAASSEAVTGLIEIAKDVNATSSARVTAWRSILELAIKGDEVEFVKDKLIEAEANRVAGGWRNHV